MSNISAAASVVLARTPGSRELFLVRRADNLRFFGGFHAFPGGKAGPPDAELAAHDSRLTARHVAAVRELFEETGVLLARQMDGTFPLPGTALAECRKLLLDGNLAFADLLSRFDLSIHHDDLTPVGSLVTPAFSPVRFDTLFFVANLPSVQVAEVWPGELAEGSWLSADTILQGWEAGESLVSPPTVALLETIRGQPVETLPQAAQPLLNLLAAGMLHPIWFSPGVLMIPLFCAGLPPSTHTNAFLVGTETRYLLDPGASDPTEQQRLFELLDHVTPCGGPIAGVVLTHHHPDHVGAAAVCARRLGVPILAHPATAEKLRDKVTVKGDLLDGTRLDLGVAPHRRGRWALEAVFTPGHAVGHLAFYESTYRLLFAGDMVSTLSSIIIAPPEGDLAQYLASLKRLRDLPTRLLLPAHGSASARAAHLLDEAIAHRLAREQQLLDALSTGIRTLPQLTQELYRGLPAKLLPLAELQVRAGLEKLQREGRVEAVHGLEWQLM
jgi:glyoxylase-like metal-dependent hydrolase (beta-lactamase superfamily II)/8-oxo-dGTP pyrophosphatase MutT (NUDIX family)